MIEWVILACGTVTTLVGTVGGALVARRSERERAGELALRARSSNEGELRRMRIQMEARIADGERERSRLRRALMLGDGQRHSRQQLTETILGRLGGLALVESSVIADELGLELARVGADASQLAALALGFFSIDSIFAGVSAVLVQTETGVNAEARLLPLGGPRRAVVVACRGQRPAPLAIDAMLAYAEAASLVTDDPAPPGDTFRGHRHLHHDASDSARALCEELDGFRSNGSFLGVSIVDGPRLLASASLGGAALSTLQRLASALPDLTASASRRLGAPWVRSDIFFHDGSAFAIRRVSPKGRFFLVAQSERAISDLELDRISGGLRRLSPQRQQERSSEGRRAS